MAGLGRKGIRRRLLRGGLLGGGLLRSGRLGTTFKQLLGLSEPLIVAYEGNNPLETGRYPQPTTVLELDGVDQYTQTDYKTPYDQPFTFTAYVNGVTGQTGYMAGENTTSADANKFFAVFFVSGLLRVSVKGSAAVAVGSANEFLGKWVCIQVVSDGVDFHVYVDGNLETSSSVGSLSSTDQWGLLVGARYNLTQGATATYFNGKIGPVYFADGINLPLNQTSGTVALDRNDNANQGTLINGASWVVDNTLPWQADVTNEEGYTLGTGSNGAAAGVIIPPSTNDPTKDCLGNDLQWAGSVYPVIPVPEGSSALSFDNAAKGISIAGFNIQDQTEFSATCYFTSGTVPFLLNGTVDGVAMRISGNNLQGITGVTYYDRPIVGVTIPYDEWFDLSLVFDETTKTITVSVNGVASDPTSWPNWTALSEFDTIGNTVASAGAWEVVDAKASKVSDLFHYQCTETSGTTVFDISGNGNHGTLVNGPTWVNTRDGYGTNLNQLRGFTFDGAVRIPALADGSGLDARDGLPLTNPPVLPYGHNNSENTENGYNLCEDGSVPSAAVNLGNFNLINFSDTRLDLIGTIPTYTAFRRHVSSVAKDRLIIFHDTLPAGSERNKAITYTNPLEDGTEDPWFDESGVVWEDQAGSLWYNP